MKFAPMKAIVVNLRELRKVTQYPPLLRLQMGGPVQKEKPHFLSMGSFCLHSGQQRSSLLPNPPQNHLPVLLEKPGQINERFFFLVDSLYRLLAGCLTLM